MAASSAILIIIDIIDLALDRSGDLHGKVLESEMGIPLDYWGQTTRRSPEKSCQGKLLDFFLVFVNTPQFLTSILLARSCGAVHLGCHAYCIISVGPRIHCFQNTPYQNNHHYKSSSLHPTGNCSGTPPRTGTNSSSNSCLRHACYR